MSNIDRVTLEITQPSMNPTYRPDDITWTLAPSMTDSFSALVAALLAETTINDQVTLGELLASAEAGDHDAVKRVMDAFDEPVPVGGSCYQLELHEGGARKLSLFLNTCRLSAHYRDVFKPALIEHGQKTTSSHELGRIERKPQPPSGRFEVASD